MKIQSKTLHIIAKHFSITTATICSMEYQLIVYNQIMWTCDQNIYLGFQYNAFIWFKLLTRKNNVLKNFYIDQLCPLTSSFVNMMEAND